MVLPGFETWQIGLDGVNTLEPVYVDMSGKGTAEITPDNLFTAPIQIAAQGNRIELLIRAPKREGSYTLSSLATRDIFPAAGGAFDIARFVVAGSDVKMNIPATLPKPKREYPLIEDKDIVAYRTFHFGQGERADLLTGFGFTVDGDLYDGDGLSDASEGGNVRANGSSRPKPTTCIPSTCTRTRFNSLPSTESRASRLRSGIRSRFLRSATASTGS